MDEDTVLITTTSLQEMLERKHTLVKQLKWRLRYEKQQLEALRKAASIVTEMAETLKTQKPPADQ